MFGTLLTKNLTPLASTLEDAFLEEIKNSKSYYWITADGMPDGSIGFMKDREGAGFFTARLKRFPKIVEVIKQLYPHVNVNNSYVTKMLPRYVMKMHIDKNRDTAILIPLGSNKGQLTHAMYGFKFNTHTYTGPTLARVDIPHSANNSSDEIRYALTLETPGTFKENTKIYI